MLAETRSISIPAAPGIVHGYVSDAGNLPRWAPAFAAEVRRCGEHWTVTRGEIEFDVAVLADRERGTIDVVSAADPSRGAYLRVLPNGEGSELLFTLFFARGTPRHAIDGQMATVDAELAAVREACQERSPQRTFRAQADAVRRAGRGER